MRWEVLLESFSTVTFDGRGGAPIVIQLEKTQTGPLIQVLIRALTVSEMAQGPVHDPAKQLQMREAYPNSKLHPI